jgi:hypothetical protein
VDCTTDGFPDIIVFGKKAVLLEVKDCSIHDTIVSRMEPTQLVFMFKLKKAEYRECYVAIHDSTGYFLYRIEDPIGASQFKMTFSSLKPLAYGTEKQIAGYLEGIINDSNNQGLATEKDQAD